MRPVESCRPRGGPRPSHFHSGCASHKPAAQYNHKMLIHVAYAVCLGLLSLTPTTYSHDVGNVHRSCPCVPIIVTVRQHELRVVAAEGKQDPPTGSILNRHSIANDNMVLCSRVRVAEQRHRGVCENDQCLFALWSGSAWSYTSCSGDQL